MFKASIHILPPNTINTVMNTTAINHTVRNILMLVPSRAKQSWDKLHYTPSGSIATVDFTTAPLTVKVTRNEHINKLKALIGDYNMSYTVCRIDMPLHKDKFETGSYRVLLQLSDNSVRISRQNDIDIDTHKGDLFIVDTNRWHSSTTLSGDCYQEYVIIEDNWCSAEDIPTELSSIAR